MKGFKRGPGHPHFIPNFAKNLYLTLLKNYNRVSPYFIGAAPPPTPPNFFNMFE